MDDLHLVLHAATVVCVLWLLRLYVKTERILRSVVGMQQVFAPTIDEMHKRLNDVWESQSVRDEVLAAHERQEAALKRIEGKLE